jgi:hypothetical protein
MDWKPGEAFLRTQGFVIEAPADVPATGATRGNRAADPRERLVRCAVLRLAQP